MSLQEDFQLCKMSYLGKAESYLLTIISSEIQYTYSLKAEQFSLVTVVFTMNSE